MQSYTPPDPEAVRRANEERDDEIRSNNRYLLPIVIGNLIASIGSPRRGSASEGMGLRPLPTAWGSPLAPVSPAGGTPAGGRGGGSSSSGTPGGGNVPSGGELPKGPSAIGGSSGGTATQYGGYGIGGSSGGGVSSASTSGPNPTSGSFRIIYHGTTSAKASRLLKKGFRNTDAYFAPDYRAAQAMALETGRGNRTVMIFKIPVKLYESLGFKEGPIGEYAQVRPADVGSGMELILKDVAQFNAALKDGTIGVTRWRVLEHHH